MQEEQREERETITLTRSRADGEQHAWRAEVRSTQAALECAKRGFKCIYAASLPEVTARICEWRQALDAGGQFASRSGVAVVAERRGPSL